jgi:hypothetical protein
VQHALASLSHFCSLCAVLGGAAEPQCMSGQAGLKRGLVAGAAASVLINGAVFTRWEFSGKTRIPAFGPILIAAAFAPLSLHGQSADSLASDHPVPVCAARESGNARPFDKSRPEVLVGRYELTVVSEWGKAAGRWSRGELEIWRTEGGRVQGASDIDLDSLRVPGIRRDAPDAEWWLGSGDIASRDTLFPGLEYDAGDIADGGFLLAPVWTYDIGAISYLEVDSLSDRGFWGRWGSDLPGIQLAEGRDPHGTFCAGRLLPPGGGF